jgi:CRISPR-associated protein Cmr2
MTKSTKAIWASSYLFSYLLKLIIIKLDNVEIISPYKDIIHPRNNNPNIEMQNNFDPLKDKSGAGIFPDRLFVKSNGLSFEKFNEVNFSVLEELSKRIFNDLKDCDKSKNKLSDYYKREQLEDEITAYLNNYLKLYTISVEIEESCSNPIELLNNYLDSIELQNKIIPKEKFNFFIDFFEQLYYNFLIENEFGKKSQFPSTIEISTSDYRKSEETRIQYEHCLGVLKPQYQSNDKFKDDDRSQEKFVKELKKTFKEKFRAYHKYIAVVQADGDNMGSFINHLYKQENGDILFSRFSKNMLTFSYEAL